MKVIANAVYLQNLKTELLLKAKERATSTDGCRRVSVRVSVKQYSVQYKGYNLIGVTTVEASATRGTTAPRIRNRIQLEIYTIFS